MDNVTELAGGLFSFRGFKVIILLPCSRFPTIDNKLELPKEVKDFHDLQLNWHNIEFNAEQQRGRKKIIVQSIIFSWT